MSERLMNLVKAEIIYRKGIRTGMTVEEENFKWQMYFEAYNELTQSEMDFIETAEYEAFIKACL